MKRKIMALGAVLAWVCGVFGATHEGVQLWENGPLWAKTNVGANSPTEAGYYFWWGDTLGYKWQNSQWVASDGSVSGFSFSAANCPTFDRSLEQLQTMGFVDADGKFLPARLAAMPRVARTSIRPNATMTISASSMAWPTCRAGQ